MRMAKILYSEMKNPYGSNSKKTADAAGTNLWLSRPFFLAPYVTQLNLDFKDIDINP